MFGNNEIVGQKYFANAGDKLLVTSVFYTLQGEGPYAGMPAVFVRLAKCNLACDFCDTYFDNGDWYTIDDLLDKIKYEIVDKYFEETTPKWANYLVTNRTRRNMILVVTGGEPTLQNKMLDVLCYKGLKEFLEVQIETNGIIKPQVNYLTTIVCSPKCVNGKYVKPHSSFFTERDRNHYFKFVVEADPSSPYHTVPDWAYEFREKVFISPMNTYLRKPEKGEISSFWTPGLLNSTTNQQNHEYAAKLCLDNGFRLNLQMHLYTSLA